MKNLLTLFFLCFSTLLFGQENESDVDIAFDYYMNQEYDSALVYYQKIIETDKSSYYYGMMGECYKKLRFFYKAKEAFHQALLDTSEIMFMNPKRDYCHSLTDIYIEEKDYEKALDYLKLAEEKYPHFRICSNGEFERKTRLRYKFAQCFVGLNQLDSAIVYLTPYMFGNRDRADLTDIQLYYYKLLKTRYTKKELRNQLNIAIENIFYNKELDTERSKFHPDDQWYNVNCYFNFMGVKVTLIDGGYEANSWGGEPVKSYSKEYMLDYITRTTVYKNIF